MDEQMDVWMDRQMEGKINGWINESIEDYIKWIIMKLNRTTSTDQDRKHVIFAYARNSKLTVMARGRRHCPGRFLENLRRNYGHQQLHTLITHLTNLVRRTEEPTAERCLTDVNKHLKFRQINGLQMNMDRWLDGQMNRCIVQMDG